MNRRLCFLLNFICFSLISSSVFAIQVSPETDIKLSQKVEMNFSGKDGDYKLISDIEVQKIYLTERSLKDEYSVISEEHFEDVSKVKAYLNNEKIDKDLIYEFYPKRKDEFYSASKLHVVSNPFNLKVNDTIKYTYRLELKNLGFCPLFRIQSDMHTDEFELIVRHPSNVSVQFDIIFATDSLEYTIDTSRAEQTIFQMSDIPQIDKLSYFELNNWQALINLRFYQDGKLISPSTPLEFVNWYQKLTTLSPELSGGDKLVLQSNLDSLATVREKLRYIHNYVKENFRYVADTRPTHTITPFPPSTILHSKFADCKDRACLVTAIAKEVGINVSMAVVTSTPFIDYQFVHPFLYNHMICYYEDDTLSLFFDPTDKYSNFDYVPEYLGYRQALILNPENPKTKIIYSSLDSSTFEVTIQGKIDSLRYSTATLVMRNHLKEAVQNAENEFTNYELSSYLHDLLNSYFYKFEIFNFKKVSSDNETVVYSADIDLSKFVIAGKDKKYIPKIPFTLFDKDLLTRVDDSYPIHFDKIIDARLTIDLQFDSLDINPDSLILSPIDGVYFSSFEEVINNNLHISYHYYRKHKSMSGDLKDKFLTFCKEYISNKNKMYIIHNAGE